MDNDTVKNELRQILTTHHAANVRYKHFAMSSRALAVLSQLSLSLSSLLPEYSVWAGDDTRLGNAPSALASRCEFINAAFKKEHQGLIITQPNFWLQRWSHLDKQ
ncbi:MAG: hypothetical protein GQ569_10990, partial [Methylococcaceae bacterium]|nr:hypothetical protein [Methylococcaceae bacterium]